MKARIQNPTQLGGVARVIRTERGLTQQQFARQQHFSQRWLSEFESGKEVTALERAFNVLRDLGAEVTVSWNEESEHGSPRR